MINVTKNFDEATFVTHSGKFHADEVFSTILLEKIYNNIKLIRIPEIEGYCLDNKIVFDIGGGEYDHHQQGGNGSRANGIKYAAFGLLWQRFGRKLLNSLKVEDVEECFKILDKNFVQFIDAVDNGQVQFEKIDIKVFSVSDVIEGLNPNWDEETDSDLKFIEALDIARKIFDNRIQSAISKANAKKYVDEAIEKSNNGIMILEQYMPYQEFVLESNSSKAQEILYVVFKSNRGGYNIRAIAKELGSFDCRKKFPSEWAGLRNEELQTATGVPTASFCHNAGFICVAQNLEDALKLANMAVES